MGYCASEIAFELMSSGESRSPCPSRYLHVFSQTLAIVEKDIPTFDYNEVLLHVGLYVNCIVSVTLENREVEKREERSQKAPGRFDTVKTGFIPLHIGLRLVMGVLERAGEVY